MAPGEADLMPDLDSKVDAVSTQRTYQKPAVRKLTREQAILKLMGEASIGNKDADEMIKTFFFPDPQESEGGSRMGTACLNIPSRDGDDDGNEITVGCAIRARRAVSTFLSRAVLPLRPLFSFIRRSRTSCPR